MEREKEEERDESGVQAAVDDEGGEKFPGTRPLSKTEQLRKGFVEKIVKRMEQGEAPWQKPWRIPPACMPVNAVSGRRYNGSNIFYLMTAGMDAGYSDPRWVTYKQAREQGWQVRRGETGTKIEYWNKYDPTKTKDGKECLDERIQDMLDAGASSERIEEVQEGYQVGYIKHYTVFNAAQIEGIPPLEAEAEVKEFKPHERAEKIMDNCGVSIVYGSVGAGYSPNKDWIRMPDRELFTDEDHFYATVMHEIAHSTGHPSRLDREEAMKSHFGTQEYAKEELRAEMASLFIHAGIGLVVTEEGMRRHTEEHAAYVQNWMKTLKQDYKEFYRAARDAGKIADYVLAYEQERTQERGVESETAPLSASDGEAAKAVSIVPEDKKPFEPQPGGRVTFQPHDGKAKLTGRVLETDENSVTLQCGRAIIPVLREKGNFAEAPETETTHTKEYAEEQARKHVGEEGNVFSAKGEGVLYLGTIVELTPTYAIQKADEGHGPPDAILHRLKDLGKDQSLISVGQDVAIVKGTKGAVTVEPWQKGKVREQREDRDREGFSR